jgi:hypothetical protein
MARQTKWLAGKGRDVMLMWRGLAWRNSSILLSDVIISWER